jgi:tRNA(Ile)-lysidine synthase
MLIKTVEKALRLIELPIVVGVSGGPDSMALLHVLSTMKLYPIAACFNHQLRDESNQEGEFVREFAESYGIQFRGGMGDVKEFASQQAMSLEEAARTLRYEFLFQVAEEHKAGGVAVAHHAEDQVETILMNLLRGTGMKGLQGMQAVSLPNQWSKSIPLVRPFLSLEKDQILDYITDEDLPFLIDPSNTELIFYRNRIRHELIPQLERLTPGFRQRLVQTADILAAEDQALDQMTRDAWKNIVHSKGVSYLQLTREKFLETSPAIKRRLIRKALFTLRPQYRELGYLQVERALEFLNDSTQKTSNWVAKVNLAQSPKWIVFSTWETDLVKNQFPQMLKHKVIQISGEGKKDLGNGWFFTVEPIDYSPDQFGTLEFPDEDFQVWVDRDGLGDNPVLRIRSDGDQIAPLGMEGKSMKVSDLMINEKIPAPYRELWPLLANDDQVLWVPGGRLGEKAIITEKTRSILNLTFRRMGPQEISAA